VKNKLKEFRDEIILKNQKLYVPVTMDELMARFEVNLKRNEAKE